MRARAGVAALAFALVSCSSRTGGGASVPDPEPTTRVVLGYFTGTQASLDTITAFHSEINVVSADTFGVDDAGEIDGEVPADLLELDRASGIRTFACVSNYGTSDFDSDLAHAAIVTHKDQVIAGMVAVAQAGPLDGVNVDFEAIYPADRDAFTRFIADLATALHAQGFALAISVPAKTEDSPDSDWSWPFDYVQLGRSADLIQLMTYDEHGPWSDPGSVAGRPWMEKCVEYAASVIDPEKLLIGLPAYGYDWDLDARENDTSFSWKDVPVLLLRTRATPEWDATSQSVHIAYSGVDGHRHVAWYENHQGIALKAALAADHHLAGVSMWSLGQEDASFWSAVAGEQ